jgi:hypothetical protein
MMNVLIVGAFAVAGSAGVQTTMAPVALPVVATAVETDATVPIDTTVEIDIATALNSKDNKIGDMFPIRLMTPIVDASGATLVPAGTAGEGEVIHAARARALGKAGEMILAARYLKCGDTRIPLGHFKFGGAGHDPSKAVIGSNAAVAGAATLAPVAAVAVVPLMFVSGGEFRVPAGTHAMARTTAPVALSKEAAALCVAK